MLLFELLVGLFSLLGFCLVFKMAFDIPLSANKNFLSGPGSFPALISGILIILSICWVVDTVIRIRKTGVKEGIIKKEIKSFGQVFGTKKEQKRLLVIIVLTLIYTSILIPVLGGLTRQYGFTIATFLYLFVSIKIFGGTNWIKTLTISAPTALIVYTVFTYILKLPMPR